MAPEQREKSCISIRMGIQMRGRILWGLDESPLETPLPSPAVDTDQPCTTGKGRTLFNPIPLALGLQEEPSPFQHSPASPAMQPPTSTEPPGPLLMVGLGLVWWQGHGCFKGLFTQERFAGTASQGPSQLLSLPQ